MPDDSAHEAILAHFRGFINDNSVTSGRFQAPELHLSIRQCLAYMRLADGLSAFEIGNRTRDPEHARIDAHGKAQFLGCLFEQFLSFVVGHHKPMQRLAGKRRPSF
jgi:hypothetical protein